MKLRKLTEWIKGKFEKYKPGGMQVQIEEEEEQEPEQIQEERKRRREDMERLRKENEGVEVEHIVSIDAVAAALAKLGQAGYTMGEYPEEKQEKKEIQLTNNRRKMKGMPMVRRQQLRRAQRNRKRRSEE